MGRWLALLSLAVLVVGIAAIDPCKRQPFRGRCPSENGAAPKRSQFVLRYYSRSGECVSYPYGHCASDESEPVLYRLKEECEDACIKNNEPPANLGDPKDQPYSTIGPLDVKAEGVKIVTQEPLSITESPGTKSTTTEAVTTTESTTTEKQTEATTTTTEKSTTVAATTTTKTTTTEEAKTTQKITTTEEPSTTNIEKTTTTEKVTEAPTTKTTTPETTFTVKAKTTEEPKTTVREAEAPKFEKKVDATTEADVESTTPEVKSTTAPRRTETHAPVVTRNVVVVQYATEAATEATTTKDAETTRSPRTECERRRSASASSKIRGGFVPVCDANGEFEKTQCEPNGEQCFCVDRRGIEVANTRNHDGKKPNCEQIAASPRTHLKSCGGVAEKGPCSSNLGRWFYSESEKKCMQFIYSGCGGNGNNYDSERDCLARCASVPAMPVLKCLKGEPLKSKQGDIVLCGKANCPTGYKCTQQQQTSFCCPEEIEKLVVAKPVEELNAVCKMSKERGPCDKYELRFHFDIAKNECKYFFWGGCEGNANNFVDIESCEQTCGISKTRGFTSAPRPPTPQTTMGIRVTTENQQVPTTEEPVVEEQEVDENDSLVTTTRTTTRARPVAPTRHREPATVVPTTVRPVKSIEDLPIRENHPTHAIRQHMEIVTRRPVVPMLPGTNEDENRCIHPKDSGNCRGQFIRWFYDNQKKLCDVFTYTGCEGNGNNFASREECNAICHKEVVRPVIPDFSNVCKHDVDAGECPGVFQRFAFDTESGECRPFTYGGCGGNGNNFATIAECRASCQKATAVKQVNKCDNDVEAGQCTGAFTRFGYDKEINDCKQFVYGGCGGNGNNFPSITKCRNSCVKKSCKPTPPCESGRCQLLNDNNGCPFCSCEPVKQPSPPATNDRCPHFSFADCQEPCLIIKNRRGCQECKCPELPSTVIPPNPHPPAPHHEVAQPPSRPTEVGPPSPGRANSPGFRDNSVTEGIRVTTNPSLPNGMLNDLQEKCMQPVEPGPCTNFADRWFFSSEDGTCHPFKYGGCAGNKNHFFTQRECEIHCGRFLRPADNTQSSEEEEEKNNFENKQFAAKRLDVISPVPVENYSSPTPVTVVTHSAPGSYDESATDEVIEMTTQTPKVNGVVRVEPKEDREIVTKINTDDNESEELSELPNNVGKVPIAFDLDKLDETIVKDAAPVPTISAETTTKAATTASVVPTEAFDARVVCSFPADAGSCFNYVTRWFFNSQTGQCEQFSFGQCGGNGNNFNDRTTCELKCMIAHPTLSSQVPERCTYDKNSGFGQGYNVKWYFNMKNLRCEQFVYEGQGGNSNQFETLSDCERICTPQPTFNKPAVGATTRLVQNLEITTAATEAPTTRSVPSTEAHTTRRAETTATPTTVTAPSTESVQVQTTRAAAPPAPETATAQSRQLKPLPDISVNTVPNSKEMTSEEIDKDYEELDKDLIRPAVPTLAPQQTTEEPQVLPVVPNQPEPIQPFEPQPQPPKELPVLEASSPGTEPRPPSPAHASKTIVIEEIEKPAVQETTTKQPHYTASPISLTEEPTRDEQLKIVGKSAVATHNYQTGEVHLNGITNFGDEKLSVEKLSEISGLPSCPNNARELRHPNTGAPFMCLPGKNQCPQGSNCYFNGVNFFCCPNIEDPYDKHVFGGYGGEEAKNGYKVFGPLRIRRLMDEIPLRAKRHVVEKRQTSMDLAFNTVPVSFNLDSVIAPLRFDAEKPRSVSRAERMKKPRPPQHGNQMCLLPLIKGDCKEAHLRYFYDRHSDSCRLFYYSGCQGNGNNFGSLEDCQRLCVLGNQPRESYVLAADISTPSVVSPGQCPTGAPLGGSAPVLCGNSTDSIGCPTGYYCRGGPPDVCCPGIAPNSVSENKIYGIKQHTVASASVEEKSVEVVEKSGRRGYHKEALLATPKYMCPDASDPLMGSDGEPQICGTGINADGMKMCPKGFYCAIDSAKGSRLCCPLYGAAQRIPAELVLAPYFGRRASNPGEVIGRGSLPTDADASTEVKSREKSTEVPAKNLEFDVTGVKDVPSTSAPTSTSVEVVTKQEAEEDSDEYEDDEPEGTTKPQRLMMKDEPNRHNRIQEKTASESPKAADIPAETMNIDMPKDVVTPAVEETPVPTKSMDDKSICHIKPNEGRACRADEKAPRTNLQYFYSAKDNRCKLYFYKGCGGTDNRFEKKADCEALCLRK